MRRRTVRFISTMVFAVLALLTGLAALAAEQGAPQGAITVIDEFKTPGLEAELSGIYPHPSDPNLYYALANLTPPYRHGQTPKLAAEYRGKLLTIDREGRVRKAVKLADDDFGDLEFVDGSFYAALTNAAEIAQVDPETGAIARRIALPSPAGGLGFDRDRGVLIAQLYVGHPHLAVVDLASGQIVDSLWSEESAMGLAKVDGDWLCTWASGWDPGSFSELRVLDQRTGKPLYRIPLDAVHTALAPATDAQGQPAFISLVTVDSQSGETVIRKYRYVGERNWTKL